MTPIERIRIEVARVKKEHTEMTHFGMPGTGFCGGEHDHPCPTLKLAEKVLKLAEALATSERKIAGLLVYFGEPGNTVEVEDHDVEVTMLWLEDTQRVLADMVDKV